ncbi:MAG: aminotransferase [Pseudomonadota bacterium]
MRINPAMTQTEAPPVMEARRWIAGRSFPADRPLINVSQAAPVDPPPDGLRRAMADAVLQDDAAHLYGPVLGLPDLRAEVATQFSASYGASISTDDVGITSGCNQAFAAVMSAIAGADDEVLLPTPWYFNHKMWLDMVGVRAVAIPPGPGLLPEPAEIEARISDRTRALVLVTPNNPAGVEYPATLLDACYDIARRHDLALIIDETYRDFDKRSGPPHTLLSRPDWRDTVVQLYSFSKAYRLTGHRVGSIVAAPHLLAEIEKFLDTVAICPNQVGQRGALWGMRNLCQWLAGERAEILDRRAAIEEAFHGLAGSGWILEGSGAYFAYVRHPFDEPSDLLAQRMVAEANILLLPGTMFMPEGEGHQHLRIAFANVDRAGIGELADRLVALTGPRLAAAAASA